MRAFHVVMAIALAAATLISIGLSPNSAGAVLSPVLHVGVQYPCTRDGLADAVADVSDGQSIDFDCDPARIDFFEGDAITISSVVEIQGSDGSSQMIFDGNNQTNFFVVEPAGELRLYGLVLQHGAAPTNEYGFNEGGAINNMGALAILGSTFRENHSVEYGGAISSSGPLNIRQSAFIFNNADVHGGALDVSAGTSFVENTTFSGNTASETGSAINMHPGTSNHVRWSTFVQPQNTSPAVTTSPYIPLPGAPPNGPEPGPAVLIVNGSLFGGYGQHCTFQRDSNLTIVDILSNDDSCLSGTHPWENLDLHLGALWQISRDGQFLAAHPLVYPSPAIDATLSNCPDYDQTGAQRPLSEGCDLGAVEAVLLESNTFCADSWTGAVHLPTRGACGRNDTTLEIPTYFDSTFCVNIWNGATRSSDQCSRSEQHVTITGDGNTTLCVNRWNGTIRINVQCSRSETREYL